MYPFLLRIHYENTPIQYNGIFYGYKNEKFHMKKCYLFVTFGRNWDCWYSLEPPHRGGSNEYPQSMFYSRNKKNNVYPCKPQWGLWGSKLHRHVFVMYTNFCKSNHDPYKTLYIQINGSLWYARIYLLVTITEFTLDIRIASTKNVGTHYSWFLEPFEQDLYCLPFSQSFYIYHQVVIRTCLNFRINIARRANVRMLSVIMLHPLLH